MLAVSTLALVLLLSLEGSLALYIGYRPFGQPRMPMCATPNKPCRLRITLGDFHAEQTDSISTPTCTCSGHYECSRDWTKPNHVVSRKVISTSHNITFQMMFCRPVEPKLDCGEMDIALVAKGSLVMPHDIHSYNCRCEPGQPLLLHQRWIGQDHMTYHDYVCAYHKRNCSSNGHSPCLTINTDSTLYNCKCPQGTQCHLPTWGEDSRYGYCSEGH